MKRIELYKANWCGHCQAFQHEWEKIRKHLGAERAVEYEINKDPEKFKEKNIEGFPTILIIDDKTGSNEEYHGNRSYKDIMSRIENPQTGGGSDYKHKYIKYKTKYVNMKKEM